MQLTAAQLAAKHGIHQTMAGDWKRQMMEGLTAIFSGKAVAQETAKTAEAEVEKLHAKIGQLVVEREFFGPSVRSMSLDRRRQMIEPGHAQLWIAR